MQCEPTRYLHPRIVQSEKRVRSRNGSRGHSRRAGLHYRYASKSTVARIFSPGEETLDCTCAEDRDAAQDDKKTVLKEAGRTAQGGADGPWPRTKFDRFVDL